MVNLAGDAIIPSLEADGLHIVPGYDPTEPESLLPRFTAWRDTIFTHRLDLERFYDRNPSMRAHELALCREDPVRRLALWGWIEEPRAMEEDDGFHGHRPFVPFAGQVKVVQAVHDTLDRYIADLYLSKSRGWGASWLLCYVALDGWLCRDPWRVRLLSRKEDLVDKPLDMDSLFAKIDYLLLHLPPWMIPRHKRQQMMLKNLDTGAQIAGESTGTKSVRGGRATWVLYDEAAFIPDFPNVFGTGAGTTNHRVACSTESFEEGDGWYRAWNEQKAAHPDWVIEADYVHNPMFTPTWAAAERERHLHDPETFEIEYLRNPYVGDRWIYPQARDLPILDVAYDPNTMLVVSIDPGRADDTAIIWGQPITRGGADGFCWLQSYEKNARGYHWYAHILTGIDPEEGDPAYEDWRKQNGWTIRELEIVEWTRTLPWEPSRVRYVMDPAGAQRHIDHMSWHIGLLAESKRLRDRLVERKQHNGQIAKGIAAHYEELKGKLNQHEHRRVTTRTYLPYMVFRDTHGAKRIKECLEQSVFNNPSDLATSQPAPVHDQYSHIRSAVEYACVYATLGYYNRPKPHRLKQPKRLGRRAA